MLWTQCQSERKNLCQSVVQQLLLLTWGKDASGIFSSLTLQVVKGDLALEGFGSISIRLFYEDPT